MVHLSIYDNAFNNVNILMKELKQMIDIYI